MNNSTGGGDMNAELIELLWDLSEYFERKATIFEVTGMRANNAECRLLNRIEKYRAHLEKIELEQQQIRAMSAQIRDAYSANRATLNAAFRNDPKVTP